MVKSALCCGFLLALVAGLPAQDGSRNPVKVSGPTTINGCLEFSSRQYHLVDSSGQSYQLQYEANHLIHYVGQKVEITGKPGIETIDTTVDSLASSAIEVPVFQVKTVKGAGGTCQASTSN